MKTTSGLMGTLINLQKKMSAIQSSIASQSFTASAAAGLVTVSMEGSGKITKLTLDPALLSEDAETVSEVVMAAINAATTAKEDALKAACKDLGIAGMGGIKLPI